MTPLYDALGQLTPLVLKARKNSTVVVLTDGMENCSREVSAATVKSLVKTMRERADVNFLGADFDAVTEAAAQVGVGVSKSMNVTRGNYSKTMETMALRAQSYASTGVTQGFTDEERREAAKS
jgi:hypothetical protein